jgi:hypothetical protein
MELTSLGLSAWYHVLLGLSVELGLAAGGLLFVACWVNRPCWERSLVVVFVAAYVWMVLMARGVGLQAAYWTHYLAFVAQYYPPAFDPLLAQQTQQDYQLVLESTNQLGWLEITIEPLSSTASSRREKNTA